MDDGDIDRNGIPDMIQRDPVVVPAEPLAFGVPDPDPGLPGITVPIEATAEPAPEPSPQTMAEQQHDAQVFQTLSNSTAEVVKTIGEGLSNVARK